MVIHKLAYVEFVIDAGSVLDNFNHI
jgi:hypothetical protein